MSPNLSCPSNFPQCPVDPSSPPSPPPPPTTTTVHRRQGQRRCRRRRGGVTSSTTTSPLPPRPPSPPSDPPPSLGSLPKVATISLLRTRCPSRIDRSQSQLPFRVVWSGWREVHVVREGAGGQGVRASRPQGHRREVFCEVNTRTPFPSS